MQRYPGAQPFTTEQRRIFFGRDKDLDDLHQLVQLEELVVLYGKSGLGKSSLLNAGLIPRLQESGQAQPLTIRFGAWTEEAEASPLERTMAYPLPRMSYGFAPSMRASASSRRRRLPESLSCMFRRSVSFASSRRW
mgnify:CR=1 FL=1